MGERGPDRAPAGDRHTPPASSSPGPLLLASVTVLQPLGCRGQLAGTVMRRGVAWDKWSSGPWLWRPTAGMRDRGGGGGPISFPNSRSSVRYLIPFSSSFLTWRMRIQGCHEGGMRRGSCRLGSPACPAQHEPSGLGLQLALCGSLSLRPLNRQLRLLGQQPYVSQLVPYPRETSL